jgi:hypothetical protein
MIESRNIVSECVVAFRKDFTGLGKFSTRLSDALLLNGLVYRTVL